MKFLRTKSKPQLIFIAFICFLAVFLISRFGIYDDDPKLPVKIKINIDCKSDLYFTVRTVFQATSNNLFCLSPSVQTYTTEHDPIQSGEISLRLKKYFKGYCEERFSEVWMLIHPGPTKPDLTDELLRPKWFSLSLYRYRKEGTPIPDTITFVIDSAIALVKTYKNLDGLAYQNKVEVGSGYSFRSNPFEKINIVCKDN